MRKTSPAVFFLLITIFLTSTLQASNKDILLYGRDGIKRIDKAIEAYQKLVKKDGWEKLEITADYKEKGKFKKIIPGEKHALIPSIRKRLMATGELKKKSDSDVYDEDLKNAVIAFQTRHGLENDGVIGAGTIDAMNVSPESRLNQLKVNRERFAKASWPPAKYIHANIPDYQLYAVRDLKTELQMRIVVGLKKNWNTPEVQSQIKNVVLNPKWHVPTKIIKKELLKKIIKEPDYLEKQNMSVFEMKDGEKVEIDPATYDWKTADPAKLQIVQDSGDDNALGHIKFLFPNPYDIYMHDTPQKSFFSHQMRAASHGCVRVQKPMDLAHFVFSGTSLEKVWTEEKIKKEIEKNETLFILIKEPVDVFVDYFTAWVDEDGVINFREDIYKKDVSTPASTSIEKSL